MWDLYMTRVVEPGDTRLTDPTSPFQRHPVYHIVHRHRIRVLRSLENAKYETRRKQQPLYVVQAKDEVVHKRHESLFTAGVRSELLQMVNPEKNKGLPGFLPLYTGMRLLLASKDGVRNFGLFLSDCPILNLVGLGMIKDVLRTVGSTWA